MVELDDEGHGVGLDELGEGLDLVIALELVLALVELLEEDDLLSIDRVLAGHIIGTADSKLVVVKSGGNLQESLGLKHVTAQI